MKLKHWMESLSRSRKKSKTDTSSSGAVASSTSKKKLTVKDIIMPISGERSSKHVRNNYPAVAAYLDLKPAAPQPSHLPPSHKPSSMKTFRPVTQTSWRYVEPNQPEEHVYDIPSTACACARHLQPSGRCPSEHVDDPMQSSFHSFISDLSDTSTLSQRRPNIRTNPWVRPENNSLRAAPVKPARKRPAIPVFEHVMGNETHCPYEYERLPNSNSSGSNNGQQDNGTSRGQSSANGGSNCASECEMAVCWSDKSVGTDGDESLLEDASFSTSFCGCDECCESGSCYSRSTRRDSSTVSHSFSSDTIQPEDDSSVRSDATSTPTILNDFEYTLDTEDEDCDSAVSSPGSQHNIFIPPIPSRMPASHSMSSNRSSNGFRRSHFSPAGSHTSWKYFDDEDERDSGLPTTASSLGSPGSLDDYNSHSQRQSVYQSNSSTRELLLAEHDHDKENQGKFDIDSNIEIIRQRLQRQVDALKFEKRALERQQHDHFYDASNAVHEDFVQQKKTILAETLTLLRSQLDEQNSRLSMSYSVLHNLQKRQKNRYEPRNRDGRALQALYNQSLRETFC